MSSSAAYRLTDLPALPEGWQWHPLQDLVDQSRGICYGIVQPGPHDPGGVPMVNSGDVHHGTVAADVTFRVSQLLHERFARSALRGGEVLVTLVGANFGQVALAPPRFAGYNCSRPVGIVPVLDDATYVMFALRSPLTRRFMDEWANTTAQPTLNLKELGRLPIPVPPARQRGAISALLASLDARIALLRETSATLDAIAQALFKSWFVDFDPVRAKHQGLASTGMDEATAALFPDGFEESALGLLPKGWTATTVSDVAGITKGKSYSSKDLAAMHETALVTLKSFERGGGFRLDGFKPYTGTYKTAQVVCAGDLIVAYTDVTQAAELIGKPAIVVAVDEYSTLVASLDVGIVRPVDPRTTRQFLYGLFRTSEFQAHTLAHTSGTTVLHLSKDAVGSYAFVCPPTELAIAFSEVADAIARRRQVNIDQMRSLATLRDTLLPRLISGQLRLPEAEALAT